MEAVVLDFHQLEKQMTNVQFTEIIVVCSIFTAQHAKADVLVVEGQTYQHAFDRKIERKKKVTIHLKGL